MSSADSNGHPFPAVVSPASPYTSGAKYDTRIHLPNKGGRRAGAPRQGSKSVRLSVVDELESPVAIHLVRRKIGK
ncbi:hypothetical protein E2C01_053841 [Portunus trituberculatus]|uniref:Uncharacterized protein n=1 Tax=Portunus trituberculatus TaxID=210409 RepID=A0A5B7GQE2_PORTR|nr:hypothetical protein [Portunus trituberculatus]